MAVISESVVGDLLLAMVTLLGILYYFMTAKYDYWKKRGVKYIKPTFPFGNLKDQFLQRKTLSIVYQDIYNGLDGDKFGGFFEARTPILMIRDVELIERILVKDFSNFINRDFGIVSKRDDPLTALNLFALKGDMWRNIRSKITPTFTTAKLKGMLDQICNSGDDLLIEIRNIISRNEEVEVKKLSTLFTIDVVASCAFGLQFKPNSPEGVKFRKMVRRIFDPSAYMMLQFTLILFLKPLAKLFGSRQTPKEVSDYLINLVKNTMQFREKNNVQRNDFLQLMMNLKDQESTGKTINWKKGLSEEDAYLNQVDYSVEDSQEGGGMKVITDKCIAAQTSSFLTTGLEGTTNAVAYMLYELACNPHVQERLQQEVDSVLGKFGGKLTYEGLNEMRYLDMVAQEQFRKYAQAGFLRRVCNAPYQIPGTNVVIEKGMTVMLPLHAIHNDPAIYPEPEKFIPERFEGNNHRTTGKYFPFGDGPRVCIAMRFVIYEVKACIAQVMSQYSITVDPRTKTPFKYSPNTLSMYPIDGIFVNFQRRT